MVLDSISSALLDNSSMELNVYWDFNNNTWHSEYKQFLNLSIGDSSISILLCFTLVNF